MARTVEFVLGLIGGIFGILGAGLAFLGGGLLGALGDEGGGATLVGLALLALLLAVLAIVAAVLIRNPERRKLWAWVLTGSGIVGFLLIGFAWLLAGPLLLVAGIMGLVRKDEEEQDVSAQRQANARRSPQSPPP